MLSTIRSKVIAFTLVVGVFLSASGHFALDTMGRLRQDGETKDLARIQTSALYEINLLLAREVAAGNVRELLHAKVDSFGMAMETLLEKTGPGESSGEPTTGFRPDWETYREGVLSSLDFYDQQVVAFDLAIRDLAPLLSKISSAERAFKRADADEYEYHIETAEDARAAYSELRNTLYKLVALPHGDELDQTELAIRLNCEKRSAEISALLHGSDDLELDEVVDADLAKDLGAMIARADEYASHILQLLETKVNLELGMFELSGKLDAVVSEMQAIGNRAALSSEASQASFRQLLFAIAIGATSFLTVLLLFFRSLLGKLGGANRVAEGITNGDLNQEIRAGRRDEIGMLFGSMDGMQTSLRNSLEEIKSARLADQEKARDLETSHHEQLQQATKLEGALAESERQSRMEAERSRKESARTQLLDTKVAALLAVVESAASGDLTVFAEEGADFAIDRVATSINFLISGMNQDLGNISSNSGLVLGESNQMQAFSSDLSNQALAAEDQANRFAKDAESLKGSVGQIEASTDQLRTSNEKLVSELSESAMVVQQASTSTTETNLVMQRLQASTESIGEITKGISDIAHQTNLLALNASIEAARVGEHGKGFAVVASEVKQLAMSTSQATADIGERIATLELSTQEAIEAIELIGAIIDEISLVQGQVDKSIAEQSGVVLGIDEATSSIAEIGDTLVKSASDLTLNADESKQHAQTSQVTSAKLAETAGQLQGLVHKFQL